MSIFGLRNFCREVPEVDGRGGSGQFCWKPPAGLTRGCWPALHGRSDPPGDGRSPAQNEDRFPDSKRQKLVNLYCGYIFGISPGMSEHMGSSEGKWWCC